MLNTWVKNIVFFLLLVKILENLITGVSIRKYFKLFSGIILIIILIQPLLNYNQLLDEFDQSISKHDIDFEFNALAKTKDNQNAHHVLTMKLYKEKVSDHICQILSSEGLYVQHIAIEVVEDPQNSNYGMLQEMYLTLGTNEKKTSKTDIKIDKINIKNQPDFEKDLKTSQQLLLEKKAKNMIYNFYNLSSDNIHIIIEEG